jgi:alpha-galactosidase
MKNYILSIVLLCGLFCYPQVCHGQNKVSDATFNALAPTPPMGWNTWNKFRCDISESLLKEIADAMVSSGMKDAGYEYLVIDDGWQVARDGNGNIMVDSVRFPHGMKVVADYVHSKGLKFGIYSCAGSLTCQNRPGSRGYQFQDARQYAAWGVDYLKYDWCNNEGQNAEAAYKTMSDALKASGRPIVFSICEWGTSEPWKWGKGIGHLWRTTNDIRGYFTAAFGWGGLGITNIIDAMAPLYEYAGPGHWNDADMLEVGNGGMTQTEDIAHMSMWCMLATPLMAGNDIRNMDATTKAILTNKEAIAVNQDAKGKQARLYVSFGDRQVWVKSLAGGDVAVCFFNRNDKAWTLDFDWSVLGSIYHKHDYAVRDLWKHKNIGTTSSKLKSTIPSHGVLLLRLTK